MMLDHLVDVLQRAPKKLQRRALRLHKQLTKEKPPKRRKKRRRR